MRPLRKCKFTLTLKTACLAAGLVLAFWGAPAPAYAASEPEFGLLLANEFQVTFDANDHSTPTIGQDAIGYYVVYEQYPVVNGVAGNGSIYYQRIANGQLVGTPVTVANSPQNRGSTKLTGTISFTRCPMPLVSMATSSCTRSRRDSRVR